jgi:hypothetical protein
MIRFIIKHSEFKYIINTHIHVLKSIIYNITFVLINASNMKIVNIQQYLYDGRFSLLEEVLQIFLLS